MAIKARTSNLLRLHPSFMTECILSNDKIIEHHDAVAPHHYLAKLDLEGEVGDAG